MSQLPPAGRWEVVACTPDPGLAMCRPRADAARGVLYLEIGHWGELVTDSGRRSLAFSYDGGTGRLEVRVQARAATAESILVLSGTVTAADTVVLLHAGGRGVTPFDVQLRRTHHAPW
jgi:hypothetical protein